MRTLFIVLTLPVLIAAAPSTAKDAPSITLRADGSVMSTGPVDPKKLRALANLCRPKGTTMVGVDRSTTRPRTLGSLPPAKQQLAVVRTSGGCSVPTVIRDNIGGR